MKTILETLKRKWAEYLLEIFVIMIGIIGAFMLNSWHEDRLDRQIELNSLLGLHQEFRSNQNTFNSQSRLKEKAQEGQSAYLEILKNGNETLNDILKYNVNTGGSTFNPSNGVLNSLISTGTIEKISNDSWKYALTS